MENLCFNRILVVDISLSYNWWHNTVVKCKIIWNSLFCYLLPRCEDLETWLQKYLKQCYTDKVRVLRPRDKAFWQFILNAPRPFSCDVLVRFSAIQVSATVAEEREKKNDWYWLRMNQVKNPLYSAVLSLSRNHLVNYIFFALQLCIDTNISEL